jgi:hypothetical protein
LGPGNQPGLTAAVLLLLPPPTPIVVVVVVVAIVGVRISMTASQLYRADFTLNSRVKE